MINKLVCRLTKSDASSQKRIIMSENVRCDNGESGGMKFKVEENERTPGKTCSRFRFVEHELHIVMGRDTPRSTSSDRDAKSGPQRAVEGKWSKHSATSYNK